MKTKKVSAAIIVFLMAVTVDAQTGFKKVYNEDINPIEQINQALVKAKSEGKFVICQVGGNWCPWCLRFADFITNDATISQVIEDNFEYIHVNYNPRKSGSEAQQLQAAALMKRLDNCGRFGFPVFVVLDEKGRVIHIQDSSFLEEGEGYNQEKVLRFLRNWTPKVVKMAELASTLNSEEAVVRQVDAVYAYWNDLREHFDENKPSLDERFGSKEWWQARQEVAAIDRECECGGFFDFGEEGPLDAWVYDCYEGTVSADSIQIKMQTDGSAEVKFVVKDAVTIKGIPIRWLMRVEDGQWRVANIFFEKDDDFDILMNMQEYISYEKEKNKKAE